MRTIKLSPKKNGSGIVSSYSINIGSLEALKCGFIDENGVSFQIEKILIPEKNELILKLKTKDISNNSKESKNF